MDENMTLPDKQLQHGLGNHYEVTKDRRKPPDQISVNQLARKLEDTTLAVMIQRDSQESALTGAEDKEYNTRNTEAKKRAREEREADDEVQLKGRQEQSARKKPRTQIDSQSAHNEFQLPSRAHANAQTAGRPSSSPSTLPKPSSRRKTSSRTRASLRTSTHTRAAGTNTFDPSLYQKLVYVHHDLPAEFFESCAKLGRTNIAPRNMAVVDDLADAFEEFYFAYRIHCDSHLESREVCDKAQADLLNEAWVLKYIRNGLPADPPNALAYQGGQRVKRPLHSIHNVIGR